MKMPVLRSPLGRPPTSWLSTWALIAIAWALILAACSGIYLWEADEVAQTALDREVTRTKIFTRLFDGDVRSTETILRILSTLDAMETYLQNGQPSDLDRVERRAAFYSRQFPDFDQIRFLDNSGQEVFRINHAGAIVPHDQLQNKADREYFKKTATLQPDQIFFSAFDLNIENGKIEQPIKPMLRFATPVFDHNGQRRGVFIINYLGANVFDRLQTLLPTYKYRFRLLNSQGYWLKAERPDMEWGFMLPGGSGNTLARTNPALWNKILQNDEGQAYGAGGYLTWKKAYPGELGGNPPGTVVADDDFLVFASEITAAEWPKAFATLRLTFIAVAIALMILATITILFSRARWKVQEERDRFFNLTRDMLCLAGFDGYFKRINPAWVRTLGYPEEALLSQPFLDFVHPEDRDKTIRESERLAHGGETVNFENRYRCSDGSYRWMSWSARSLTKERLIFASARDLTERRQMEEKLRQSEERIRLMLENIKDYAIFMLDPQGRVLTWNAGAERLNGYCADEIIGRHFSCFYPEEVVRAGFPQQELEEATAKGRVENEGWRVRKDGSRFWADVVISAMRNASGDLLGFVKVMRDSTVRKEAAERIQRLNSELQHRAGMLQEVNRELEAFSYSVSHDLRAPLRHIHGFVELLQKSAALQAESSSRRQMEIIARAAREMGHLIDDLLDFSRTGRAEMHPQQIDMREMVGQMIQDREPECQGRKIEWKVGPLAPATGDPALIRLVWANLLDNALKYTRPRETARIEIGQLSGEEFGYPEERAYFIRDNGVGFNMQYASKLFGVFQRLHRAEDFEGTGIGLANVQRIILRHGGHVRAQGVVDGGATFSFSLPIVPIQSTPTHAQNQTNPPGGR